MNQELTKETAEKLMEIKGEARGTSFRIDREFILRKKGEEGLKKIEAEMERLGCPIKYEEIKTSGFYPIGWRVLSLLVIKNIFDFDEEKIEEMGKFAPKVDFIIKFFLKHFLSIQKTIKQVSKMWRKHYTIGELIPLEVDEKKKRIVIIIKNCNLHPIFCRYLIGYFTAISEMVVRQSVNVRETKCFFRGDKYHEYLITW